jgi:hypothetical protein
MTAAEWVPYCLDPKQVDISLLGYALRNSRDLPREQREAVLAYVRQKEHEAVDVAYDDCINQFEKETCRPEPSGLT